MYSSGEYDADYRHYSSTAPRGTAGRYRRPRRAPRGSSINDQYYEDGELPQQQHYRPRGRPTSAGGGPTPAATTGGHHHDHAAANYRSAPGTHDWRYGRPRRRHVEGSEWGGHPTHSEDDECFDDLPSAGRGLRRGAPRSAGGYPPRTGRGAKRGRGDSGAHTGGGGHLKWHRSKMFCNNHAFGTCTYGANCRFVHGLRLHASVPDAHSGGIYCSAFNAVGSLIEIYTGSKDLQLKRWDATPSTAGDSSSSLELTLANSLPFDSQVTACHYQQDCLFTGHGDGKIRLMLRSGPSVELEGHTAEITTLAVVESVLVSTDYEGVMKFWRPPSAAADAARPQMVCEHSLSFYSPVVCVREVTLPPASTPPSPLPSAAVQLVLPGVQASAALPGSPASTATTAPAPTRALWVGCRGKVVILDLSTMSIYRTLDFDSGAQHTVMEIVAFEASTIIVVKFNGEIMLHSPEGELMDSICLGKWVISAALLMSADGPVLMCGSPNGTFSALQLPALHEYSAPFQAHDKDIRVLKNLGGSPSYFLSAGMDGALYIWQLARGAAASEA